MPVYGYQKPRARTYGYNLDYYKNYYKPMVKYLDEKDAASKATGDLPGAQTLAEPASRGWIVDPVWYPSPWSWDCIWVPPHENRSQPHFGYESYHEFILKYMELRKKRYTLTMHPCPLHSHLLVD